MDTDVQPENLTGNPRSGIWITIAFSVGAVVLLAACLFAKHFMIWASINVGLGTPSVYMGIQALVCSGVAFAAPVYSVFLIALAPFSLLRRLTYGVLWFGAGMIALAIGINTEMELGAPSMFSMNLLYSLPAIYLGLLIPFGYLHWFRGWRFDLSGFKTQSAREPITISTLLSLTFLVSLCFFSLQFSSQKLIVISLFGILAMTVVGSLLAFATWFLMRTRLATMSYLLMGTACYSLTSLVFLQAGAGSYSYSNAIILTAFLLTSLMGVMIVRIGGGTLLTKKSESKR